MKKILAILLVLVMTVGLVPAVFADETTYTITITPADGKDSDITHEYKAYQIFTGKLEKVTGEGGVTTTVFSDVAWSDAVDTTKLAGLVALLSEVDSSLTADSPATDFVDAIAKLNAKNDDETAQKLAAAISGIFKNNATCATGVKQTNGEYTVTVNQAGYYFIQDEADLSDNYSAYTRYILWVSADRTVASKSDVPTIEKKVDDKNDSNTTEDGTTWQDSADYDVGDDVPFQITVTTGAHIVDFDTYTLTIHDKQSDGLSVPEAFTVDLTNINTGLGKVTLNSENSYSVTETYSKENVTYTATVTAVKDNTDDCTFEIKVTFTAKKENESVNLSSDFKNKKIIVTYTAELNNQAVMGSAGNPNKTWLKYSNNPYNGEDEGKTPDDTVIVFTYKVVVNKINENKQPLTGATFTLYKKLPKNATTDTEGNTTYSVPDGYVNANDKSDSDPEGTKYYKDVTDDNTSMWVSLGTIEGTDKSTFTWERIDDGDYMIVEDKAPTGYNTIEPVKFTVTAEHNILSDNPALNSLSGDGFTGEVSTGALSTDIENKAGSSLPETGGIGTTIFYVLGGLLAVGAAILLITKKRMTVED